jgi:hypothetical protein
VRPRHVQIAKAIAREMLVSALGEKLPAQSKCVIAADPASRACRRFKELLAGFYPFEPDDMPRHDAPTVLYEAARNPLAHALAIQVGKRHARVTYMKDALPAARVRELATARQRPAWTGPTVRVENGRCLISVWALAWGVHEMLRRLFEDEKQAKRANATAARLLGTAPS